MSLTTITRSKPFYVVAGAGDLAVKTVRDMPSRLRPSRLVRITVDRKDVAKAVSTLQAETIALPGRAQTVAVGVAVGAADRADAAYDTLLTRGRLVVGRIRRQKATQELKRDAGTTVRRTKAATTVAKKGAADTKTAAKGTRTTAKRTTTTARKRAVGTRTAARSATTAARKTSASAVHAASDAASKVGR